MPWRAGKQPAMSICLTAKPSLVLSSSCHGSRSHGSSRPEPAFTWTMSMRPLPSHGRKSLTLQKVSALSYILAERKLSDLQQQHAALMPRVDQDDQTQCELDNSGFEKGSQYRNETSSGRRIRTNAALALDCPCDFETTASNLVTHQCAMLSILPARSRFVLQLKSPP